MVIQKFALNITRVDLHSLDWNKSSWLNDSVINFYMNLIIERSDAKTDLPKVYAMNTFFSTRLLEDGYSAVRRWTRKVDIFSKDLIPIPVHVGKIHWCMAIINFNEKSICYYDSMGNQNIPLLNALENYIKEESLDKKKLPFDFTGWKKECVQNVPRQQNGNDCGVFSCMFAEFITRNRPIIFSQSHMRYFRQKMVLEIATGKLLL